ncbi:1,2-phenylacetyl-CoA epoxidase subunit PaaD [Paraherbaspirillum soli]|uniref:1,2-phenylacetyl-CoA epoxidase subunit PaaD n=1 Tax=Paraherbaspirillum soli TaxID=631222 RepID=A0ABW0MC86_9BURK
MSAPDALEYTSPVPTPTVVDVWHWLAEVPDPEIPAISIVDLGIVRAVALHRMALEADGPANIACVVTITPTYSGCPAMAAIAQSIEKILQLHGIAQVRIAMQLSPAWTTDWISDTGKIRLREYGIAPPAQQVIDISGISRASFKSRPAPVVACPLCGAVNTSCVSQFGSTSCKAQYRCLECMEPFDYFKPH